jgi:hypothetical protein
MGRLCSVVGCGVKHASKGYCDKHYRRVKDHGSVSGGKRIQAPPEVRFWRYVDRRGPDDCWPWTAKRQKSGYGRLGTGATKQLMAHRLSFEIANGYLPEVVMHTCDNPWCVNPAHLRGGTMADNMADMRAKNRDNRTIRPRGEAHHRAKLTEAMVRDIKARPNEKPTKLAREYGVKYAVIHRIRNGTAWTHID